MGSVTGGAGAGQAVHVWSFQVEDRTSGQVVYEVGTSASFDFDSAHSTLSKDLDKMTVEQFEDAYGIGRVHWRNKIRTFARSIPPPMVAAPLARHLRSPSCLTHSVYRFYRSGASA